MSGKMEKSMPIPIYRVGPYSVIKESSFSVYSPVPPRRSIRSPPKSPPNLICTHKAPAGTE